MNISNRGISFLQEREGYRENAYRDPAGVWTIGYGTTRINGRKVRFDDSCTKEQARGWLIKDIAEAEKCVNDSVKVKLKQYQFDALVSFVYNIGCHAFKRSTLLKTINKSEEVYEDLFTRWNKITHPLKGVKVPSKGLTIRREMEWTFYDTGSL